MYSTHEIQSAKATQINTEAGLPALHGTAKQIAWAESIRAAALTDVDDFVAANIDQAPNDAERDKLRRVVASLRDTADADWWIDVREHHVTRLVKDRARKMAAAGEITV